MRRVYSGLAMAMFVVLPFQTGAQRLLQYVGAPAPIQLVATVWKEAILLVAMAVVVGPVLAGRVLVRRSYLPALVTLTTFVLGLPLLWAISTRDISGAYAVRVYLEPIAYGLTLAALVSLGRTQRVLVRCLAWCVIPVALLALYQAVSPTASLVAGLRNVAAVNGDLPSAFSVSIINVFRPFSFFSDPNDMGLFFAITLVVATAYRRIAIQRRVMYWGIIVICLFGIFVSFSRSALGAVIGGATAVAGLRWMIDRHVPVLFTRRLLRVSVVAVSAAVALVLIVVVPATPEVQHIWDTVTQADPSSVGHLRSLRLGLEEAARYSAGVGLGRVGPRAARYGRATKQLHVENSYLQIALEAGIGFAALYMATNALVLAAAATREHYRADDQPCTETALAAAGVTVATAISYSVLPTIVSLQTGALMWAFVGGDMLRVTRIARPSREH